MKNHEANSCQDTSSLSTWKFRAKVNKFAGGRWAGWHPCGGLPFLWATHDWHHHEAFHWSEGIWRSWRNWVVGDMIFLHDQSWRMSFAGKDCSCTNSRDDHIVTAEHSKKQRSPGLTAVHQKMLKKSESKQAPSEPRHPRSSERFLFCCRRCRGEGCGTGRHNSHHFASFMADRFPLLKSITWGRFRFARLCDGRSAECLKEVHFCEIEATSVGRQR